MVIIINFYLYQIRRTVLTYRDAYGLFWYDRYKALIEAFINLLVSVILGWRIGLIGIFIGTIISTLLTSIWIEPYVLFKYGFNHSGKKYYLTLIIYTIFTALVCMLCESIIKIMNLCGFLGFIIGVIICTLLVSGLIILAFSHTNEFKSLKKKIKKLFYFLKIERKYKNA